MIHLGTLKELQSTDPKRIKSLYPKEASAHPGKMKTLLACELIRKFLPCPIQRSQSIVVDSLVGVGTTCVASVLEGCFQFVGSDKDEDYVKIAQAARFNAVNYSMERDPLSPRNTMEGTSPRSIILCGRAEEIDLEPYLGKHKASLLIDSPPFPNAHTQGKSKAQKSFLEHKQTFAGNDFDGMEEWNTKESFQKSIIVILSHWAPYLLEGAALCTHVKNYIRQGEEIRVDEWVEEALASVPGVQVEGYLSAPLGYRSLFQELHRYPLREILSVTQVGDSWVAKLECGHDKTREKDPGEKWKRARCVCCGVVEGWKEIREERIVVARKV